MFWDGHNCQKFLESALSACDPFEESTNNIGPTYSLIRLEDVSIKMFCTAWSSTRSFLRTRIIAHRSKMCDHISTKSDSSPTKANISFNYNCLRERKALESSLLRWDSDE